MNPKMSLYHRYEGIHFGNELSQAKQDNRKTTCDTINSRVKESTVKDENMDVKRTNECQTTPDLDELITHEKYKVFYEKGYLQSKIKYFEMANKNLKIKNSDVTEKIQRMKEKEKEYEVEIKRQQIKLEKLQLSVEDIDKENRDLREKMDSIETELSCDSNLNQDQKKRMEENMEKEDQMNNEMQQIKNEVKLKHEIFEELKAKKRRIEEKVRKDSEILKRIKTIAEEKNIENQQKWNELQKIKDFLKDKEKTIQSKVLQIEDYNKLLQEFNSLRIKYHEQLNNKAISKFKALKIDPISTVEYSGINDNSHAVTDSVDKEKKTESVEQ